MTSKKRGSRKFGRIYFSIGIIVIVAISACYFLVRHPAEVQRQQVIAENIERQNTPKPTIQIITDLSGLVKGTGITLEYIIDNATLTYFNDKMVSPTSGTNYFSQFVELPTTGTTVDIRGENKYWSGEQTFAIERELTAQEIQAEKDAEQAQIEADKQAKQAQIEAEKEAEQAQIETDKKKIGISEDKIYSFFTDTMNLIKGEAGTPAEPMPVFDDVCGNGTSVGFGGNGDVPMLITIDTYGDTDNLNCASITADTSPEGLMYMMGLAGIIDKKTITSEHNGFLGNMRGEASRKGESVRYLNSRKYEMTEDGGVIQLKISSAK